MASEAQEEVVPRESASAKDDRHDKEKADAIKARQIRLGHIPDPDTEDEEEEEKPKSTPKRAASRKKSE